MRTDDGSERTEKPPSVGFEESEPGASRTRDHRIKSAVLYQLSYGPAQISI